MNSIEKDEIRALPYKYQPLSAWEYWGLMILYAIPVIGFIVLIVHSFSDDNVNRRSFARSYFCTIVVAFIIIFLLGGLAFVSEFLNYFLNAIN